MTIFLLMARFGTTPLRTALAAAALAAAGGLLLVACGDGEAGPDRSTPNAAFDAAMEAISRVDLPALWVLLTPEAKAVAESDLRALQVQMRDPTEGPRILEQARRLRTATTTEEFLRARDGPIEEVWRFFLKAKPRPPKPPKHGFTLDPSGNAAQIAYDDVDGVERVVGLVRLRGAWYVHRFPL